MLSIYLDTFRSISFANCLVVTCDFDKESSVKVTYITAIGQEMSIVFLISELHAAIHFVSY